MLATGLPVPRFRGWAAAIAGDLLWFAVLLGTSLIAATIADDDRFIALVMIVAMIVIPRLARRFVPALGPDAHRSEPRAVGHALDRGRPAVLLALQRHWAEWVQPLASAAARR